MLELIGQTPVVELDKLTGADSGALWGKCEQYNPGGSVKDRIALAMIEEAEANGTIEPGRSTIVEPTSGNTGIGLALVCAAKGYRLVLTMPEDMSLERRQLLESYGATIELTPVDRVMEGAVSRARQLVAENDDYFMPDQFNNPANPRIHETTTAAEILEQFADRPVDAFVASIGTGGTITGVGRALRERWPECRIIGIEPERSAVLNGQSAGPHRIQGIGAGFVPDVLDRDVVHEVRTISDRDAYDSMRTIARKQGLLVGISAGANVFVASKVAREVGPGKSVLTILCDTGERYFSLDQQFE